jgi:putative acetyltransferase
MEIQPDDLSSERVHALLEEHLRDMRAWSPPGSVHALDLDALRGPGMSFWTVWEGEDLLGCGALMQHTADHAEIKSMRSALAHRGKGAGVAMLAYIIEESRRRGYARLSLETGSAEPFAPSRALYARFGFRECGPFADYAPDPHSVFLTLEL